MRKRRDENCVELKEIYEVSHTCTICGKDYAGPGNNAEPLASGRCCDDCNRKVIAERINERIKERIRRSKKMKELTISELWDVLLEADLFTEAELILLANINGYSITTLNDALYARYGYRDYEQMMGEE